MDEQKKSGVNLFYLIGIYAIVKVVRVYKMGDQRGRPLWYVKDANAQEANDINVGYRGQRPSWYVEDTTSRYNGSG